LKYDASFNIFSDKIEKAVDEIPNKKVISTDRHGLAGMRDKIVFVKSAWNESMTYFGIITTLVTLAALTPIAVGNINKVLEPIGVNLPVALSSLMTFILLVVLFIFGYLSFRYFGAVRRSAEISAKLSSADFLEWKEEQVIKDGIQELKDELAGIKEMLKR